MRAFFNGVTRFLRLLAEGALTGSGLGDSNPERFPTCAGRFFETKNLKTVSFKFLN